MWLFLSTEFPFLGASQDGIMYIGGYKIGLVALLAYSLMSTTSVQLWGRFVNLKSFTKTA